LIGQTWINSFDEDTQQEEWKKLQASLETLKDDHPPTNVNAFIAYLDQITSGTDHLQQIIHIPLRHGQQRSLQQC